MRLLPHEYEAMKFLRAAGSDCIGEVDSEEKLAAAVVFTGLVDKGLAYSTQTVYGPAFSLTRDGITELNKQELH